MRIREYSYLVEEAKRIRIDVFVREQGFAEEFDEIDNTAKHIVVYEEDKAIATCRIYFNITKESFAVGRIAVAREWRGKKIGAGLLREAEQIILREGGFSVLLSAQLRIVDFYEKQGYSKVGKAFLDEGCPHIWMKKVLITG